MKNQGILVEYWHFLRTQKKWWLVPTVLMLLIISILIIVGQSSSLSPFIYALF